MANKKNSSTTRNVRNQKNAEKRARKVNRSVKNAKKAREAKSDLYSRHALTETRRYCDDTSYDPKTEEVVTVSVLNEQSIATQIAVVPKDGARKMLSGMANGAMFALKGEGAMVLEFPPTWTMEEVYKKTTTDVFGLYIMSAIERAGGITYADGESVIKEVYDAAGQFVDWIADCGETPDENGIVDVEVSSSAISHVTYSTHTKDMLVEFTSGSVYIYSDVPRKRFCQLVSASSVGRYFHANIRDEYAYQRVA